MYGPYGERRLPELELDLEGWRGSRPVRVGNGAATQTQLDVYGHLLDAAHVWHTRTGTIDDEEWRFLRGVVDQAAERRHDPGAGIWEMRGEPRHFVHSKVMVWVALDRGIRLVEDHGLAADQVDRWREARDEVRHEIETRGVDPDRGNFVQHYGTTEVDASLLKLPLLGFVDACDDRMRATTDAIVDELGVPPTASCAATAEAGDAGRAGGRVPALLLLARGGPRAPGAASIAPTASSTPWSAPPTTCTCSRRSTTSSAASCSATSRRPSPTSG